MAASQPRYAPVHAIRNCQKPLQSSTTGDPSNCSPRRTSVIAIEFSHRYAGAIDDAPGQELLRLGFCVGRALSYGDLLAHTERVASQLGLLPLIPDRGIRIRCGLIASSRKYTADDNDFLNSFYLKDLARVAEEARESNIGKGLSELLMAEPRLAARLDVCLSIATQFHQLSPSLFPRGRWPSKGHHALVFSQQFAINSMTQQLGADAGSSGGIFAVNRPPGTGAAIGALQRMHGQQAAVSTVLERARLDLGAAFADVDHWRAAEDARELFSPWADAKWNDARAKVFIAALALHKEFILACPSAMRKSLQAAMDILSGAAARQAPDPRWKWSTSSGSWQVLQTGWRWT